MTLTSKNLARRSVRSMVSRLARLGASEPAEHAGAALGGFSTAIYRFPDDYPGSRPGAATTGVACGRLVRVGGTPWT